VHVAQTLNDPWAGTAVFACALLLAGAIAAAVTAPARAPKSDTRAPLQLAGTLTVDDRRQQPPLEPPDLEPATFAQRWDAMHPEFETGRVEIVDAVTPPVLGFEPPRERRRLAESEQELVTPAKETRNIPKNIPDGQNTSMKTRERPDVCERNGLKKVSTRGGRSWRCRR
jgi:hypothetical protein